MALKNARGNKLYYDYETHKIPWPAWERRQKILLAALIIGAVLVCTGLFTFLLLTK